MLAVIELSEIYRDVFVSSISSEIYIIQWATETLATCEMERKILMTKKMLCRCTNCCLVCGIFDHIMGSIFAGAYISIDQNIVRYNHMKASRYANRHIMRHI